MKPAPKAWWHQFWFCRSSIHNVDMDNRPRIPNELTKSQQLLIMKALAEKGAIKECYRCGNTHHTVHNALTMMQTQVEPFSFVMGGPIIPSAIVFCSKCGLLSTHALAVLGLLEHSEFRIEYVTA